MCWSPLKMGPIHCLARWLLTTNQCHATSGTDRACDSDSSLYQGFDGHCLLSDVGMFMQVSQMET